MVHHRPVAHRAQHPPSIRFRGGGWGQHARKRETGRNDGVSEHRGYSLLQIGRSLPQNSNYITTSPPAPARRGGSPVQGGYASGMSGHEVQQGFFLFQQRLAYFPGTVGDEGLFDRGVFCLGEVEKHAACTPLIFQAAQGA
jgi:hypothetical protein